MKYLIFFLLFGVTNITLFKYVLSIQRRIVFLKIWEGKKGRAIYCFYILLASELNDHKGDYFVGS